MPNHTPAAIDVGLGTTALSSPVWSEYIHLANETLALILTVGGIVLVSLRIYYMLKEHRDKGG